MKVYEHSAEISRCPDVGKNKLFAIKSMKAANSSPAVPQCHLSRPRGYLGLVTTLYISFAKFLKSLCLLSAEMVQLFCLYLRLF
jgi:hypothetical protein